MLVNQSTISFSDWIPCSDFKTIKIQSNLIIATTTLAKDIKELYWTSIKEYEKLRETWKNTSPSNISTAFQDMMPDSLKDLLEVPEDEGEEALLAFLKNQGILSDEDLLDFPEDVIESYGDPKKIALLQALKEKKKSTIH